MLLHLTWSGVQLGLDFEEYENLDRENCYLTCVCSSVMWTVFSPSSEKNFVLLALKVLKMYILQLQLWILACCIFVFLVVLPPQTWKVWMLLYPWREDKALCRGHLIRLVWRGTCHKHREPMVWAAGASGVRTKHGLFSFCFICLFTFQWGFYPIQPYGWSDAAQGPWGGTIEVCETSPCRWMVGCGWCYIRHPHKCLLNGCNGFVGLKENKITILSLVGQKASNSWFNLAEVLALSWQHWHFILVTFTQLSPEKISLKEILFSWYRMKKKKKFKKIFAIDGWDMI